MLSPKLVPEPISGPYGAHVGALGRAITLILPWENHDFQCSGFLSLGPLRDPSWGPLGALLGGLLGLNLVFRSARGSKTSLGLSLSAPKTFSIYFSGLGRAPKGASESNREAILGFGAPRSSQRGIGKPQGSPLGEPRVYTGVWGHPGNPENTRVKAE